MGFACCDPAARVTTARPSAIFVCFEADQARDGNFVRVRFCHESSLSAGCRELPQHLRPSGLGKSIVAQHKQKRTDLRYIKDGLGERDLLAQTENGKKVSPELKKAKSALVGCSELL